MDKTNKIIFIFLLIFLIFISGIIVHAEKQIPDNVLVSVNGEIITIDFYQEYLTREIARLEQAYKTKFSDTENSDQLNLIKKQIIEQILKNEILRQTALEFGLEVSTVEIEKELNSIMANYTDKETFNMILEKAKYSLDALKYDIMLKLSFNKIADYFGKDVEIADEELEEYYQTNIDQFSEEEKIRPSHILVDSLEEAQAVLEKLDNGVEFGELAKNYSTCPSSEHGGDLGYVTSTSVVPKFYEAAKLLKIGQISEPIETQFGWHIIKVVEKKEAVVHKFTDIKENLSQLLLVKKKSNKALEYLTTNYDNAEIQFYLDFLTISPILEDE